MLIGKWVLMAPHKRIGHITDLHYTKLCIITWHLLYGEDQSANITLLIRRTLRILKSSSSGRKSESSFDMKPQVSSKSMATMPRPIPIIQINKEPCGINKKQHLAFKLSQINRHSPLLHSKTNVVLDLCAAPGGWTQVVGRTCGPQTAIIAVDILPIRSLGKRNITTIVGDITTDKCKADINRAIQESTASSSGEKRNRNEGTVDVVLHDGAPNIGASYDKDAYEQTELAVHAPGVRRSI